jgi:hypothetical protein
MKGFNWIKLFPLNIKTGGEGEGNIQYEPTNFILVIIFVIFLQFRESSFATILLK